jgi:hypothetical protein
MPATQPIDRFVQAARARPTCCGRAAPRRSWPAHAHAEDDQGGNDRIRDWTTTPFEPEEAHTPADFLLAVTNLELAAKELLAEFYARPERQHQFTEAFLDPVSMGRAVEQLHPVLSAHGEAVKKRR